MGVQTNNILLASLAALFCIPVLAFSEWYLDVRFKMQTGFIRISLRVIFKIIFGIWRGWQKSTGLWRTDELTTRGLCVCLNRVQTSKFLAQVSVVAIVSCARKLACVMNCELWTGFLAPYKKLAPETGRNRTCSISGKFRSAVYCWYSAADWTIDWRSDFFKAYSWTRNLRSVNRACERSGSGRNYTAHLTAHTSFCNPRSPLDPRSRSATFTLPLPLGSAPLHRIFSRPALALIRFPGPLHSISRSRSAHISERVTCASFLAQVF